MNVGDYVRTRDDGIQKITFIDEFSLDSDEVFFGTDKTGHYADISTTDIIGKPSTNIIDLIQEGDYVNGYKVDFIQNNEVIFNHNHPRQLNIMAKDIKSIVTKEQFESMEYKVGE